MAQPLVLGLLAQDGGTYMTAGRMTGTGVAATHGIITTTAVRSVTLAQFATVMQTCTATYPAEIMR